MSKSFGTEKQANARRAFRHDGALVEYGSVCARFSSEQNHQRVNIQHDFLGAQNRAGCQNSEEANTTGAPTVQSGSQDIYS